MNNTYNYDPSMYPHHNNPYPPVQQPTHPQPYYPPQQPQSYQPHAPLGYPVQQHPSYQQNYQPGYPTQQQWGPQPQGYLNPPAHGHPHGQSYQQPGGYLDGYPNGYHNGYQGGYQGGYHSDQQGSHYNSHPQQQYYGQPYQQTQAQPYQQPQYPTQSYVPMDIDTHLEANDGKVHELITPPPPKAANPHPIPAYQDMPDWMRHIEDSITELQRMTRQFMLDNPFCSAMLDMGSGKTLAALSALSIARPAGHMLVIAPKAIAVNTWSGEIADWNIPLRAESLALGPRGGDLPRKKRHERYDKIRAGDYAPSLFVIGQNNVRDLVDYFADDWPFPTVIIDEAQGFKNPNADRFKALASVRPQITRMIQLTGTPVPKSSEDLWAQIYLLDQGRALGETIGHYHRQYFHERVLPNNGRVYDERAGALREILHKIPHLALASKNTELKLPDLYFRDHEITLDESIMDEYRHFVAEQTIDAVTIALAEQDLNAATPTYATPNLASIISIADDETKLSATISADNAAVLRMKQLQMATGTIYLDNDSDDEEFSAAQTGTSTITELLLRGTEVDEAGQPVGVVDLKHNPDHELGYRTLYRCGNRIAVNIHNDKLDVLAGIIDDARSPVLVAYHFRSDSLKIHHELHRRGYDVRIFDKRPDMFQAWNRGEIPVMLIHPASAGHGLNFQHGGHTLVWYSLPDSLEHYLQANARLYRPGQKHDVTIHRLITADTKDAEQPKNLRHKQHRQQIVLDALHHDPHNQNVDRTRVIEEAVNRGGITRQRNLAKASTILTPEQIAARAQSAVEREQRRQRRLTEQAVQLAEEGEPAE